jgi:DNA invertase Pin-like site-specific DNA recombinase
MPDDIPIMVGLVRVSTDRQADSGLGLAGQLKDIEVLAARMNADVIETYHEVESGKHDDINRRPRLRAAVAHALEVGGVLVIAKMDRLVRSTSVMQYLKDSRVRFMACDNPHANELTIDILTAVAANEARAISDRTRKALEAYKDGKRVSKRIRTMYPDGVPASVVAETAGKLGASLPQCRNLTADARARGTARSVESRRARALKSSEAIGRLIAEWLHEEPGLTLRAIADKLNERRRKTPRGKAWGPSQVSRVLRRLPG